MPRLMHARWVVLGLLLCARLAHAQQHEKAAFDEAWNRGQDLFNLGKYDEARAQFEKARNLQPKLPGPWRYLGKLGKIQQRWQDCVDAYVEAIKLKPDSNTAEEVRGDLETCRNALGRPSFSGTLPKGFGALSVNANVESAHVTVDGIGKGATPLLPVPLVAGKHTVRVEKDGYLPAQVEIEVVVTIVVDVEAKLEPDPNAKHPDDKKLDNPGAEIEVGWISVSTDAEGTAVLVDGKVPPPGPQASYEATPGVHLLEVSAPGRETYHRRVRVARGQKRTFTIALRSNDELHTQRVIGYSAFGVAAAAAATGLVFGYIENQKYEDARDAYEIEQARPPNASNLPPGLPESHVTTRAEYEDMKKDAEKYALVSNVSYGVAALALGISIYYFIEARSDERTGFPPPMARRGRPRLLPTVLAGGSGGVGGGLVYTGELSW